MRVTKEAELQKQIAENGVIGIYLLYGSEEYLIGQWKKKLTEGFEIGGFNFSNFDGQQLDLNELYDATQQLPLFAPNKCVVVSNINGKKLDVDEIEKIQQIFDDLPPETVLILTAPLIDKRTSGSKKLIALSEKHGVAVELSPRDTNGIIKHLQAVAQSEGSSIDRATAQELVVMCGNELLVLTNELRKLAAFSGDNGITKADLRKLVTPSVEQRVFDLGKMILAGNLQASLKILANLFYLKESPIMIVATLIMSYVDLYRAKTAQKEGKNAQQVIESFGYKGKEFRVKNAFSSRISLAVINRSLEQLYQCDKQMKSTMIDDELLLEKTVISLIYLSNNSM